MELQSDLVPGLEFAAIQTDLVSAVEPAGAEATTTVLQQAPRYVTTSTVLPLRLAAFSGVRRGPNTLRVRLLGHDGSLVLEQWLVIDIGGSTTGTVVMTRSCKGVSCPGSGDPIAAIACLGGKCQDPRCSPEQPDFCSQPECTSACRLSGGRALRRAAL